MITMFEQKETEKRKQLRSKGKRKYYFSNAIIFYKYLLEMYLHVLGIFHIQNIPDLLMYLIIRYFVLYVKMEKLNLQNIC